ncbi:MAG: ATP-binding cassette domain-containing protein [Erysipelotrichales bacterium]|nr:ATP-binding cassette domain-containing protein [Erysipelotrichales bacterium]
MSLLSVINVSHGFGERRILENASFRLLKGEHIALVGANGEGKTSFIKIIMGELAPDAGKIEWCKRISVGYLDQHAKLSKGKTIRDIGREAFDEMFKMETELLDLYNKMASVDAEEMEVILDDIGEIQSTLESNGFYLLDNKIEEVAKGLGLMEVGLERDVSELSGGQRSKVLLLKLLLENPKILILDEPTNFLDEVHIVWLTNFLINYENAFLLVSHDIPFVNQVANVIYHLENGNMVRYSGTYNEFMRVYEQEKLKKEAAYIKQQKEIERLEDFVARNKANAATANMAKSRQKVLDKMEVIEKVRDKPKPKFNFKEARTPGKNIIEVNNLLIGYNEPLSTSLNFIIERNKKIAIKGANGIGKSTLMKTLLGLLKPLGGEVIQDMHMIPLYFEQEAIASRKTALDEVWEMYPSMSNAEVRGALASCGLLKTHIESLMIALSGGENAKVRLCKLMLSESNVLVLDEPTNHLDKDAKEALKEALQNYKGTIILVSHERDFYEAIVDDIWNAEEWTTKLI